MTTTNEKKVRAIKNHKIHSKEIVFKETADYLFDTLVFIKEHCLEDTDVVAHTKINLAISKAQS